MPTSSSTIYFRNAAGLVREHPGYVRVEYAAGRRHLADLQALLGHLGRALAKHGGGKLLIDQRVMVPFSAEEQAYMLTEWLPRANAEGGYRWGAVVQAQDVFARLATATVATQVHGLSMTYQYFADEAAAVAWLVAQ
ncbi:STAS/SEC14 domain-containing protein [Hymenobacter latericus]|uniref:STAS/SEC14 domain-containing protein n=1 Tax=Hymenobacter sp. YIM 151858-1 TaxID=2987688 RepID=UPI0022273C22|nr:STAS/SEC14 domain-containing protein [Hymenobacter sp. YIM 151858-1]UYZ57941.1 STAS/SEC14 domain-containing protein [Hymenobacter sp. YIM 151858-1]